MTGNCAIKGAGGWQFSTYTKRGRVYSRARRRREGGGREEFHLGPIHLETVKIRGCYILRIVVGRMQQRPMEGRVVMFKANLLSLWCDAVLERNGWKAGNQVQLVMGHDELVGDPLVGILRERVDRYNRDQRYLAWKWEGTYEAGRRKRLQFRQCVTCEKRSREEKAKRDIRAGRLLHRSQRQLL